MVVHKPNGNKTKPNQTEWTTATKNGIDICTTISVAYIGTLVMCIIVFIVVFLFVSSQVYVWVVEWTLCEYPEHITYEYVLHTYLCAIGCYKNMCNAMSRIFQRNVRAVLCFNKEHMPANNSNYVAPTYHQMQVKSYIMEIAAAAAMIWFWFFAHCEIVNRR